jgi:endonuclease/exonuclease/phosphatase family metal-dependent hydrolase
MRRKRIKQFLSSIFSGTVLRANYIAVFFLLLSYLSVYINPLDFWFFSFFGLAYPILFFINAGFFVFWALKRNKFFLISLLAILLGWYHFTNTFQFSFSGKEPVNPVNSFSFLSFNVRLFNYYQWIDNPETNIQILELINDHNADIIAVQEYVYNQGNPLNEHPEYLKLHSMYSHIAFSNRVIRNRNFGIATFSKYPIVKSGTIRFKNSNNISIYSDIKINDDTIRVFNNHLQSIEITGTLNQFMDSLSYNTNKYRGVKSILGAVRNAFIKRSLQVQILLEQIEKSPYPVIIAGDFNETPVSYTYRTLRRNLDDVFVKSGRGMGTTYITRIPYLRIDYILHDKALGSYNYKKIPVILSDHYPVKCQFYFRERSED